MARSIRVQYSGALYHIISRGIEKKKIFFAIEDYQLFIKIFKKVIERYNWECFAYCLMPNHYHLLIKTLDPNLSVGMCKLNGDYSQKFNVRHGRVGHLFQGRYKSILVCEESYKNKLIRYISLNPLRANLVKDLSNWQWNGHLEMIGKSSNEILNLGAVFNQFSDNIERAQKIYIEYLAEKVVDDFNFERKILLGSDDFKKKIRKYFEEQSDEVNISKKGRYAFRPSLSKIFKEVKKINKKERNKLIHQAHVKYGYNFSEIGRTINMHQTTIGKIVSDMII